MSYDHHTKAGNPGDVIKHVALIAALRGVLSSLGRRTSPFVYADTFAAYAQNPVLNHNRRQWNPGIGRALESEVRAALRRDPAATTWLARYLPEARVSLHGGMYPGSCLVAFDEIIASGRRPKLLLWDIEDRPIENLRTFFAACDQHEVFQESAASDAVLSPSVMTADFVFVDPPGHDDRRGNYPTADDLAVYFDPQVQAIIMWLPLVGRQDAKRVVGEHTKCATIRKRAEDSGLASVQVKTGGAVQDYGCQLLMRLPEGAELAVRSAVDAASRAYGWT